jgi:hypothetical protein
MMSLRRTVRCLMIARSRREWHILIMLYYHVRGLDVMYEVVGISRYQNLGSYFHAAAQSQLDK